MVASISKLAGFVGLVLVLVAGEDAEKDKRLGLLASTLGVAPVPGYVPEQGGGGLALISGGGGTDHQGNFETEHVPVIGGAPYAASGSGFQGGNGPCQCVPVEHCKNVDGPGTYPPGENQPVIVDPYPPPSPPVDPGYVGDDDQIGTNPHKDGAGVIDIRIVNKPLGPGKIQCLPGQVFCCDKQNQGSVGESGGNHFPGGGYGTCGHRSVLNVPGWVPEYGQAKFGAYPWMAVILGKGNNYIGAGALLNSNYVLTVAHKVQSWKPGTFMKVRLGEWNAKDDDEPHKNVEIEVADIQIHPQFNPDNLYNDVAIIKLTKPIDINAFPHIRSACLSKHPLANNAGQRCWVAGFGKDAFGNGKHSYIMKEVDLPIVESHTCENLLKSTRLGKHFELNKHSFLCAGGEEGKDACTGDGGSPLMCENNGVWNVVGLVAWGIGCAEYAVPGVYVNVQNYLPWIENNINY